MATPTWKDAAVQSLMKDNNISEGSAKWLLGKVESLFKNSSQNGKANISSSVVVRTPGPLGAVGQAGMPQDIGNTINLSSILPAYQNWLQTIYYPQINQSGENAKGELAQDYTNWKVGVQGQTVDSPYKEGDIGTGENAGKTFTNGQWVETPATSADTTTDAVNFDKTGYSDGDRITSGGKSYILTGGKWTADPYAEGDTRTVGGTTSTYTNGQWVENTEDTPPTTVDTSALDKIASDWEAIVKGYGNPEYKAPTDLLELPEYVAPTTEALPEFNTGYVTKWSDLLSEAYRPQQEKQIKTLNEQYNAFNPYGLGSSDQFTATNELLATNLANINTQALALGQQEYANKYGEVQTKNAETTEMAKNAFEKKYGTATAENEYKRQLAQLNTSKALDDKRFGQEMLAKIAEAKTEYANLATERERSDYWAKKNNEWAAEATQQQQTWQERMAGLQNEYQTNLTKLAGDINSKNIATSNYYDTIKSQNTYNQNLNLSNMAIDAAESNQTNPWENMLYGAGSTAIGLAGGKYLTTLLSSRNYKKDINPNKIDSLNIIKKLDIVNYKYKDEDKQRIGLIAEDTPDLLTTNKKTELDVVNLFGVLLDAVKKLTERIEIIEAR